MTTATKLAQQHSWNILLLLRHERVPSACLAMAQPLTEEHLPFGGVRNFDSEGPYKVGNDVCQKAPMQ